MPAEATGVRVGCSRITRVQMSAEAGVTFAHIAVAMCLYGLVTAHAALGGINIMFYEMTSPNVNKSAMVNPARRPDERARRSGTATAGAFHLRNRDAVAR